MVDDLDVMALDVSDRGVAATLLAVQWAAYAIEAELIGYPDMPMLRETLDELIASEEEFLGAYAGGVLVGAVSWVRLDDGTVDIYRLVVEPRAHRRGVATSLLDVLDAVEPTHRTIVSTGSLNAPALAFYGARGFVVVGEREVGPGIGLTDLERRAIR